MFVSLYDAAQAASSVRDPSMLTWGSMSIGVVVALGLALSAQPKRVFLDAVHFDGELRAALIQELGAETIVRRREDAELWVRVQAEERMQVEVIAPPDTMVVARSFSLRDGPQPAVRSAVLLISDAASASPAPITPKAFAYALSIGGVFGSWQHPLTAQLGVAIDANMIRGDDRFGVRLFANGLGCCALETGSSSGKVLELALLLEASTSVVTLGPIGFEALARAGAGYSRFDGHASLEDVVTAEQTASLIDARIELGASAAAALFSERAELVLSAGATIRAARLVVRPPMNVNDPRVLDPGVVSPWGELALRMRIF